MNGPRRANLAATGAILLSLATFCAAVRWNTWTAAASDASGYVSQARLWLADVRPWGNHPPLETHAYLTPAVPLAQGAPWPEPAWTLSPLGYRPALTPAAIVPTYPAGLPLMLATAALIGGPMAVYLVAPAMGGLGVWATFLAGRRFGGNSAGLISATLLAASPIWLRQSTQPMSDIPAAACWTLALAAALRGGRGPAVAAGALSALAIAIRPNLAPCAAAIAAALIAAGRMKGTPAHGGRGPARAPAGRSAWGELVRPVVPFGLAAAPGVLFVAALHTYLYGSPLRSGYGDNADLYSLSNVTTNAGLYASWLMQGETSLLLLALAAPMVAVAARPRPPLSVLWLLIALTVAMYLPYAVFEAWWYIRFLAPALPAALILVALTLTGLAARLPRRLSSATLALLTIALAAVLLSRGRTLHVLDLAPDERRYALAAEAVRDRTPAHSAFISLQHSGSLNYYLGRPTLRWELLDPAYLDAALSHLASRGVRPYLLLDAHEAQGFRDRFSQASETGRLDWPPRFELRTPTPVRLFDPADRTRYFAGEHIRTELIFPPRR